MKSFNYRCTFFDLDSTICFVPTKGTFSFLNVSVERQVGESATEMFNRVLNILKAYKATPFIHWVFGGFSNEAKRSERAELLRFFKDNHLQMPIWLTGDGYPKNKVYATQILALVLKPNKMAISMNEDATYNRSFSDTYGRYTLWAGNPQLPATSMRDEQVKKHFYLSETLPDDSPEKSYAHVVRTWIYLDELLKWYDPFNLVRNDFFTKRNLYDNHTIPSSTGIGAANVAKNPMSLTTLMVQPKSDALKCYAVPSPLQCPALNYKSSFSRAHLIEHPDFKWLLISGTASIFKDGESAYIDDIVAQIDLTMQVVKGILDEQKMRWSDVTRAIIYLKSPDYLASFNAWCEKNDVEFLNTPFLCDVCRDELLFEIELDAITTP